MDPIFNKFNSINNKSSNNESSNKTNDSKKSSNQTTKINNKINIKKPKCFICKKKTKTLIPFNCSYCNNNFCTSHRLPEEHECVNYNIVKINSFVSNKKKLIDNKIEESKIIKI